jgi:hypothetical protein
MPRSSFSFPITTLAGSSIHNLLAICKSYKIDGKYRGKLVLTILVAAIFGIFNLYERIVWKKHTGRSTLKEPPVFVIGFWRSGTTLLHNLLCQDPRAAYTTTFHTVFPNLVITQSWWLKPLARLIVPSKRPFDNVRLDMDFPQEEEFGLMNLQSSSIYKFFLFPTDFDRIVKENLYTSRLSDKKLSIWNEKYREMVLKASANTGGSRFISKNPCNISRLGLIKEMYPDARFIFIHRDPYWVVESLYRFILDIFPGVQLQETPREFSRKKVTLLYREIIRTYIRDRNLIDPDKLVELSMEDLMEDPLKSIKTVYDSFHFDDFDKLAPELHQFLADENHSRKGSYALPDETIHLVNQYLEEELKFLGYNMILADQECFI